MSHVEGYILYCAQLIGVLFILLQLLFAESACIGAGCIYVSAVLG